MHAIITGASRGLGKALAVFFAGKGFNLELIAKNSAPLEVIKRTLEGDYSVSVNVHACDFSNPNDSKDLANKLSKHIDKLDLLINNVGLFETGFLEQSNSQQLERLLNINLLGAFNLSQAFIPLWKKQKRGHVINIGSIVTELPRKDIAAYTISKFALKGLTVTLCDELKDHQVKVTEIIPGSINTSSWDGVEGVPKQDFIQTQELVNAVWMCFDQTAASNIESIIIRPLNRDF